MDSASGYLKGAESYHEFKVMFLTATLIHCSSALHVGNWCFLLCKRHHFLEINNTGLLLFLVRC